MQDFEEFSNDELKAIEDAIANERLQLQRIDKLSLIDVDKDTLELMRKNANENIERGMKILAVYGKKKA